MYHVTKTYNNININIKTYNNINILFAAVM